MVSFGAVVVMVFQMINVKTQSRSFKGLFETIPGSFALLLAVLLSIRTYSFYTQYYKTAIQERRRLIESINDNTLIQVNF